MKTVYLHVGNFKTGTSAIQKYCSDNRALLLAAGVDYLRSARPSGDRASHGTFPLSLFSKYGAFVPDWYDETVSYDQVARSIADEIAGTSATSILISSEEFYRLPSFTKEVQQNAMMALRQIFDGCRVKVIFYVREPMDFLKSWYNQVNKSALPTLRFTDFFALLDKSFLMPHINAVFWRECFGDDCLILRPYEADKEQHILGFLELLSVDGLEVSPSATKIVNPARKEKTLERDRIAKIMALPSAEQRHEYLRSRAFSSMERFENYERVILKVNDSFDIFCAEEGLEGMSSRISLGELLVQEERINPRELYPGSSLRSRFYALMTRPWTRDVKRMLKKVLP